MTPCRLHLLKAAEAPVAVVIRRGPSAWFHIARWWYERGEIEHGAWTRIKLYPERCAISADGDRLAVFALGGEWGAYFAVSRAPWLHALAAWKTVGTWTTGSHFAADGSLVLAGCAGAEPFDGHYPAPVACQPLDMHWVRARLFRELNNGWRPLALMQGGAVKIEPPALLDRLPVPLEASPDAVILGKSDPQRRRELVLVSLHEKHREYYLVYGDEIVLLPDLSGAEWLEDGRLIATTFAGHLQLLDQEVRTTWSYDMNPLVPSPEPAPEWARTWSLPGFTVQGPTP